MRHINTRRLVAIYLVLIGAALLFSTWIDHVSAQTFWVRVHPFFVRSIFYLLLLSGLILQTKALPDVPRWQIWRRYDGLTTALLLGFVSVVAYDIALSLGLSRITDLSPRTWDIVRNIGTVAAYIGIPIAIDINISGYQARRDGRQTHRPVYDDPSLDGLP